MGPAAPSLLFESLTFAPFRGGFAPGRGGRGGESSLTEGGVCFLGGGSFGEGIAFLEISLMTRLSLLFPLSSATYFDEEETPVVLLVVVAVLPSSFLGSLVYLDWDTTVKISSQEEGWGHLASD